MSNSSNLDGATKKAKTFFGVLRESYKNLGREMISNVNTIQNAQEIVRAEPGQVVSLRMGIDARLAFKCEAVDKVLSQLRDPANDLALAKNFSIQAMTAKVEFEPVQDENFNCYGSNEVTVESFERMAMTCEDFLSSQDRAFGIHRSIIIQKKAMGQNPPIILEAKNSLLTKVSSPENEIRLVANRTEPLKHSSAKKQVPYEGRIQRFIQESGSTVPLKDGITDPNNLGFWFPPLKNEFFDHLENKPAHLQEIGRSYNVHFLDYLFSNHVHDDPTAWRCWVDGVETVGPVNAPVQWKAKAKIEKVRESPLPHNLETVLSKGKPEREEHSLNRCAARTIGEFSIPQDSMLKYATLKGPFTAEEMRQLHWYEALSAFFLLGSWSPIAYQLSIDVD